MSAGKVVLVIVGAVMILAALGGLFVGGSLLLMNNTFVDSEGYYNMPMVRFSNEAYAITSGPGQIHIDVDPKMNWGTENLATVKVTAQSVDSNKRVFVGVAESDDLANYLSGANYAEVASLSVSPEKVEYRLSSGNDRPEAPTNKSFWVAKAHGAGIQVLEWGLSTGKYSLVVMNEDGSAGVDARVTLGARVPFISTFGWIIAIGSAVLLVVGGFLAFLGVRRS